ncbi:DUF3048 domain-containing protein [Candidatus Dojkabacteria bacterium]|nr:DUF3048 domain-containing protein [Candidatus Dojkabacteria bacterium]
MRISLNQKHKPETEGVSENSSRERRFANRRNKSPGGAQNKSTNRFKLQPIHYYSAILIVCVTILSFVGLEVLDRKTFDKLSLDSTFTTTGNLSYQKVAPPKFAEVRDKENPVNGVLVTTDELNEMESRKLVVISLNNHSNARPQAGLSFADMVVEVLAEGGITRYNAYYYQNQSVEKIGPIRSARSYMLEYFLGFDDPIFVHEGQASYPPQETPVPEINTLYHLSAWDIESMQTAGSRYRDPARIRSSGYVHSLMTGFELINDEIERLGWVAPSNIEPLKFKFSALEEERGETQNIEIRFTSLATSSYKAAFDYDPETNTYLRSVGGKADYDALTNSQIAPSNVIVEYHNYRDARDGHSRIIIDMEGEDRALIFRDGEMIEAKWKKDSKEDRTKYYDKEGNEIELNRGQIWVSIAIKTAYKDVTEVVVDGNEV